jgi:predicted esterase
MRRRLLLPLLVALAVAASGCVTPLLVPPGPAPMRYRDDVFADVAKATDIVYASPVSRRTGLPSPQRLDLYQPVGDTASNRPAIVWIHGGSFKAGTKTSPEIVDLANAFARKGYVSISISYRLSPDGCAAAGATYECVLAIVDAKHDAQAAVRWVRANAALHGIDPTRIATGGSSAGAITALNVGYDATEPGTSGNPGHDSSVGAAMALSGARLGGTVEAGDAPSLLFHGTADLAVPYAWATKTVDDARTAGLEAYLTTWDGGGHVPYVAHRQEILDQTTNFFYWSLDLDQVP